MGIFFVKNFGMRFKRRDPVGVDYIFGLIAGMWMGMQYVSIYDADCNFNLKNEKLFQSEKIV